MADQFVAEIRIFPFNFPPLGWATCDGQLLAISQNTALFSLVGTNYGGNGTSNFALPNLGGRVPMATGFAPTLTGRSPGDSGGSESVTLTDAQLPAHTHGLDVSNAAASFGTPEGHAPASALLYGPPGATSLSPLSTSQGTEQPHNNLQPYLTLLFCIAMQGIFPPRS